MADDVVPAAREDEDLVVNLSEDEDTPPKQAGEKPAAAKPPPVPGPTSAPPQAGLEALQRQVVAERQERERVTAQARQIAAERDQAVAFAQEAERRGVTTYELYTENQIKACQDKMESLAGAAEQAMHDGDFKRASALNLEVGRLGGQLAVFERDHQVLVQQREQLGQQQPRQQQPRQQQPQPQQPQVPTDPLERAIHGRSDAAKNFIRKHPEIVRSDGTIKRVALDAHERAMDEGYQADTPGYFEFIERSLGAQVPQGSVPQVPRGRAPTVAAPVSAGGGGGNGGIRSDGTFVMTPKMRRLAEEQGVTPQEWARNYDRLLREGRITPIT